MSVVREDGKITGEQGTDYKRRTRGYAKSDMRAERQQKAENYLAAVLSAENVNGRVLQGS